MEKYTVLTKKQILSAKAQGFLRDKTIDNKFNARILTRNGNISSEEAQVIAKAANLYGNGRIVMTTRLSIELQGVAYENIEPLKSYLKGLGIEIGGTGNKIRPIVSCKGTTCSFGLIDTYSLSEEIHQRFFMGYKNVVLPHKFKIAVGGCPNNCVKPNLNDIGIIGQCVPNINYLKCKGCKICLANKSCPNKVISVDNGKVQIDKTLCKRCGRCIGKCPFHVFDEFINGYAVYIGGRWGRDISLGKKINKLFITKKEVFNTIEKAILYFKENAKEKERFAQMIERIGFAEVEKNLI